MTSRLRERKDMRDVIIVGLFALLEVVFLPIHEISSHGRYTGSL